MNDQLIIPEIFRREINADVQETRAARTPRWGESQSFSWASGEGVEEDVEGTGLERGPPRPSTGACRTLTTHF